MKHVLNSTRFEQRERHTEHVYGDVAWAGATPVLGALCRPKPTRWLRRSGIAPAHAFPNFNRENSRKKEQ